MTKGRLIKGYAGFYYAACDGEIITCKARGLFRKRNEKPVIGDFVLVDMDEQTGEGTITEILPRKNELARPSVSNIDCMVVTIAFEPSPDTLLADKMLVQALYAGITPMICVNKSDVGVHDEIVDAYKKTGFALFVVSAHTGNGIDELLQAIAGLCVCFAGQSGVGKSSVINRVTCDARMETGDLSEKSGRGRHTTRHVELLPVNGGYVVDTPGFSLIEAQALPENIDRYYPEMEPYIGDCRFQGCEHKTEPDCAIKERAQSGEISELRYRQYLKLLEERKSVRAY